MSFPPLLSELLSHPRAPLEGGGHLRPCGVVGERGEQFLDVGDTDGHRTTEKLRVDPIRLLPFQGSRYDLLGAVHKTSYLLTLSGEKPEAAEEGTPPPASMPPAEGGTGHLEALESGSPAPEPLGQSSEASPLS